MTRSSDIIESMAIAGALACLAHCIALPVAIALLPALSTVVPVPEIFHVVLLLFAVPTTALALTAGYRWHRWAVPSLVGAGGLALLAIGVLRFGETPAEMPLTVLGSVAIAGAHLANWHYRRLARL